MSINQVIVAGNLTREPELRRTASGMPVLGMGLAINERVKSSQTGDWEDRPCFVDLVMFGNRAQAVSQYLDKGSKVVVQGKLRYTTWERDGQKRSKLEVVVDDIEFMSRQQGQQNGNGHQEPRGNGYQQQPSQQADDWGGYYGSWQ